MIAKHKIKQDIQRYRETGMDTTFKMTEELQQVSLLVQEETGEEAKIEELWQITKAKQETAKDARPVEIVGNRLYFQYHHFPNWSRKAHQNSRSSRPGG